MQWEDVQNLHLIMDIVRIFRLEAIYNGIQEVRGVENGRWKHCLGS
jgi:hypothetical protein